MKEKNNMNQDITNSLLNGCSSYISKMNYDVVSRIFIIECIDNIKSMRPAKRIEFLGVIEYHEKNLEDSFDDQLLDSIIGINWLDSKNICVHTDKKEIVLNLEKDPISLDL